MKKVIMYFMLSLLFSMPLAGFAQSSSAGADSHVRISPNSDKNISVGWDFVHSVVAGDLDKAKQIFAPDFVCYGPGSEDMNRTDPYLAIWKERYSQHSKRSTADIAGVSLERRDGENDKWEEWVMLWFDYSASAGKENIMVKVPTQLTMRLVNGKIAELHEYYDTGSVLRKLGQVK